MPRRKTAVKNKQARSSQSIVSPGAVDLHFHGAFGIDLMTAREPELHELSRKLGQAGVAAFCPTTLSTPAPVLLESVERLGTWISSGQASGALPLGIHLEGPFISPEACGAHPPGTIRPLDFHELDRLWKASRGTLKILTFAPELLQEKQLKKLIAWSKPKKVVLSLGHSRATEAQANQAFDLGVKNVTHAWNALPFHHRNPGPMGAALGRGDTFVELIIDQVHVAPALIRWTCELHSKICFVSDCVPAAATSGGWHGFGPLKIELRDGACRLSGGHLAGGGLLLPEAFARWVESEAQMTDQSVAKVFRARLPAIVHAPLESLGLRVSDLKNRKVVWKLTGGQVKLY